MSDERNPIGIDTVIGCECRIGDRLDDSRDVLDHVDEGEFSSAPPGPAVVEEDHVPTGSANRLGQIQIPLVTGKSVQQDDRGMRTFPLCLVDDPIQTRSLHREDRFREPRRIRLIESRRIRAHRIESALGTGRAGCPGERRAPHGDREEESHKDMDAQRDGIHGTRIERIPANASCAGLS